MSEMTDNRQIMNILAAHGAAIDDCDEPRLAGLYHDDGEVAYGFFTGGASEFAKMLCNAKKGGPRSLHRTSNALIEIQGDEARAESRVIASSHSGSADQPTVHLIGGRYLDRLRRVSGCWGIVHRSYILDWNINRNREHLPNGAPRKSDGASSTGSEIDTKQMHARQAIEQASYLWAYHADRGGSPSGAERAVALKVNSPLRTFHALSPPELKVFTNDEAEARSTVIAHALYRGKDGEERERLLTGRFHDHFRKDGEKWKLRERRFEQTSIHDDVSSNMFGEGMFTPLPVGSNDERDLAWRFLSAARASG